MDHVLVLIDFRFLFLDDSRPLADLVIRVHLCVAAHLPVHLAHELRAETLAHGVRDTRMPTVSACTRDHRMPHLIHVEAHAVDGLLQEEVLLLLLVEPRECLHRARELYLKLRDTLLIRLVFLGPLSRLNLVERDGIAQGTDCFFALAQIVAVFLRESWHGEVE